jgi:TRAP-type C4-dicarboxylate transport system permease small subunit
MPKFLDAFEAGFHGLLVALAALVAMSIGLMAVLISLNMVLIKMEWGSIWWLYEGVEYALYMGAFLGAPWVLQKGAHVRVDVVVSALSPEASARLEVIMDVLGALLCLFLCYYGIRAGVSEFQDGTLPDKDLRIPNWYMMVVYALSFLLLAVEFLLRIRRAGTDADRSETGF